MADALVSAVMQTVLEILSSAALQEISLQWGLKDELNKLERTFRTIQLVIEDAELKQRKNKVLQNWLRELKDAAYDVENILDVIATEGLRRRVISERGMQYQFKSFFSLRNPLLFRLKMAHEVKNIRQKLDVIAEERHKFHLGEGVMENQFGMTLESRQTTSLVNELEIYGRHEEKEVIIKKLLDSCDQDDLSIYAIQGMGGLGKTTLGQVVYNDERTKRHFELRIWVCVSDDFSIQRIIREILESIEGGGCDISALDPLQRRLQERLMGRRYLLVLDDVWNENHRLWDELKKVLRCGSKGSMLIITTRNEKVASMMAPNAINRIKYLSEDDAWSLFRQRAFANGEGEENFIAIGKAIVKKCGGVPLAVKALGSLMRSRSHERDWLAVKESEIWHLTDDENAILPALRLSYDNLVPQMRQCFAYCCVFPKDHRMNENQLIELWMANGYISSDGQRDMHHTGHLIFKELVWRTFLQDVESDFGGNRSCKMHDLMHDLASSVMKHETYVLKRNKEHNIKMPRTLRHFSKFYTRWSSYNEDVFKLPINDDSLCSFIVRLQKNSPRDKSDLSFLLSKQQYLRALDVVCDNHTIEKLPIMVCKLKHLRYLSMTCYNIKRLPESLTHLYNLQTLKLTEAWELLELPKRMKVMKSLWFLDIEGVGSLLCTPPGLGDMTCLRRLSIFIVGQDASHQIFQLKDLDLGGKLSIKGLDNVRNLEDARSANLIAKINLTSLSLSWQNNVKGKSTEHFEEVLEGLQPHQNLERIYIKSYDGSRFPNWMSTLVFGKLKVIYLSDCPRCERLPPLGKSPCLASLHLGWMDSIKCLDEECYGDGECSFPALTNLSISKMSNLEKWAIDDSVESFPCLKNLGIRECPKLTGLPKLPNLDDLDISATSAALVRSIISLTSLTSLKLDRIAELDVLPEGLLQNHKALEHLRIQFLPIRTLSNMLDNLSALKTLRLDGCSNLEFLPEGIKHLISLGSLFINDCDGLGSFPATLLEGLSSLRSLLFQSCKKLKPLSGPLKQAPPLEYMLINMLPELEDVPESVLLLKTLRSLSIWGCEGLCYLPNWLGSLESLSAIEIWNCRKLKSLPDGFNNLKSLRRLEIRGCPELEKRCEKPKGEDWPKISHIPIIQINWIAIQQHVDE